MGNLTSSNKSISLNGGVSNGRESNGRESNGGGVSNNTEQDTSLDSIVSDYILSMDYQNLKKLYDKDYCNKLVNITADILNRRFSSVELQKIDERIEPNSSNNIGEESKQLLCIDIAKFYVKIAHLFSAILITINPEYTYTDSTGKTITKKFHEKNTIPKDATIEQINSGLCDNKIKALSGAPLGNNNNKPNTCYFNIFSSNKLGVLSDEPGIPELKELYYDAEYDLKTGEFKGMSAETLKQYKNDLQLFYKVFTQETIVPDSIQSFSDIKLKDYSKKERSLKKNIDNNKEENVLLDNYAINLRNMLKSVGDKQTKLLDVINTLFKFNDSSKGVQINPQLTEEMLDQLIESSRALIVELYLTCETDFLEGIKIYEAIVELQILKTTKKQIDELEKEKEKLIHTPFP